MSVLTVTDSTFQECVIPSSYQKLVVVEFSALKEDSDEIKHVGSAAMDGVIDDLEVHYAGSIGFYRVDVKPVWDYSDPDKPKANDLKNPMISERYDINSDPTLVFLFEGERVRANLLGNCGKDQVMLQIDSVSQELQGRLQRIKLLQFVEDQINSAAQTVITKKTSKLDEVAYGKLSFFLALRRRLQNKAGAGDIGMLDAINDSLQWLGLLGESRTFLDGVK